MRYFLLFFMGLLYFSGTAQAACPAPPVASTSDTVIQMRAHGGNAGMGPTSALDATEEGALVYDDTNDTIKICDGTNWVDVGGSGGGGIINPADCSNGEIPYWSSASSSLKCPAFIDKTNLLGYWALDENIGAGSAADSYGSQDTSNSNITAGVVGKINNAYSMSAGASSHIIAPSGLLPATGLTFSVWIYHTGGNSSLMHWGVNTGCGGSSQNFVLQTNNKVKYDIGCGGILETTTSIPLNTWVHFAGSVDSSKQIRMYINGVLDVGPTTVSGSYSGTTGTNIFGALYSGGSLESSFSGYMDEVAVWSRVLSDSEITALYNEGDGLAYD